MENTMSFTELRELELAKRKTDNLVTLEELANRLNLSYSRVRGLVKEEGCPSVAIAGERMGRTRVKSLYPFKEVALYYIKSLQLVSKKTKIYTELYLEGVFDGSELSM